MGMKWIVMIVMIVDCAMRCASCGDEERRKRKCFVIKILALIMMMMTMVMVTVSEVRQLWG